MIPRDEMPVFVITFGRFGIRNGWVEVAAKDEAIVRAWARKEYGNAWSGVCPRDEFLADTDSLAFFTVGRLADLTHLYYEEASHVS